MGKIDENKIEDPSYKLGKMKDPYADPISHIMDEWKVEENVEVGDPFIDSPPSPGKDLYYDFKEDWNNPESRALYKQAKLDFNKDLNEWNFDIQLDEKAQIAKYGEVVGDDIRAWVGDFDAGRFTGYLEDAGPEAFNDIIFASNETGIHPSIIYNVVMQEGGAAFHPQGVLTSPYEREEGGFWSNYSSGTYFNTYFEIGLDSYFVEEDEMINKGYIKEPIRRKGSDAPEEFATYIEGLSERSGRYFTNTTPDDVWKDSWETEFENEAGVAFGGEGFQTGPMTASDIFRATGGILALRKEELVNLFSASDIDFNAMSIEDQTFWMYGAFNAGPTQIRNLYKKLDGNVNIFSDPEAKKTLFNLLSDGTFDPNWIKNIFRVSGGVKITESVDPWE